MPQCPSVGFPRFAKLSVFILVSGFVASSVRAQAQAVTHVTTPLSSAWNQGAAAEDVFSIFGNPAGLAFTPGLQIGVLHQVDLEGNGQTLDLSGAMQLDDLTLALGHFSGVADLAGKINAQTRLAGALNLDGSALGFSWVTPDGFQNGFNNRGAWQVGGINRINSWLAQDIGMQGQTDSAHPFDTVNLGLAIRPFGSFWTMSAQAATAVWNDWDTRVSFHNWFQLGHFALLASVTDVGAWGQQAPTYQVGLAYRGPHFGFGSSALLNDKLGSPSLINHVRLSSARIAHEESESSLLKEFVAFSLVGDGRPGVSNDAFANLFDPQTGPEETLLALDRRMRSAEISGIFIQIGSLSMGLGRAMEWHRSIKQWQELGKTVVVYLERPGDVAYFIATAAEEIWMSPSGTLMVDGVKLSSLYFGDALMEVGVGVQSAAAGQYKTAPRQFILNGPSEEEVEVFGDLANQYYETLLLGLTKARGMSEEKAKAMLDHGGFTPTEAIKNNMVDKLVYPTDFDQELEKLAGGKTWEVGWRPETNAYSHRWDRPKKIAVIPILGTIVNGYTEQDLFGASDSSATGALTVIEAIDDAVSRADVSAIVLRVDSPGGDAMASDHIYHAVTQAMRKKPVVVSMGSYAASGGYYVSAPALKIFAQPLTLTGSIGVFALSFNIEETLTKLKVGRFDVQRGRLQNGSLTQAMNERELQRLQEHVDDTYRQFLEAVAKGRNMEVDVVAQVAEGRVWTGVQAQEKGLVDHLGHLQDAIHAAAVAAKIDLDTSPVELLLLGQGDLPVKLGFRAFAAPPKSSTVVAEQQLLEALGLTPEELEFWSAKGTKAHLPFKVVVE